MPRPFSRHHRADFHPASCVRDGRSEDLIDLGADDIRGYGRVYLCIHCCAELIQALGFIDPDVHRAQLEHANGETAHWQQVAREHAAMTSITPPTRELKEVTDGLRAVLDRIDAGGGPAAGGTVPAGDEAAAGVAGAGAHGDGPGDGAAGAGGAERPEGVGVRRDLEHLPVAADDGGADGGAEAPAGDYSEADERGDGGFFGWLEQGTGEADYAADQRDDGSGV